MVKSKRKKSSRRKKTSHTDPEAAEERILAAYGLGSGCILLESDGSESDVEGANSSAASSQPSQLGKHDVFTAFAPVVQNTQKGVRATYSLVDLHLHSTCSDGMLSPMELVKKAAANGVRIMALTDHDTMAGTKEAAKAGAQLGVRVIPGVEISAFASKPSDPLQGEVIHILAYFGPGGPSEPEDFHRALSRIRTGRLERAKCMVDKLRALGKPIELSRVVEIAGPGVAPGRPHVARALLEAGHVASEKDAFGLYLKDDGPAFARGCEISALEAVALIRRCGGMSVLAHPWTIRKDTMVLVGRLAAAGLDGIEIYQDSTKITTYGPLADLYKLLKVGGSDFHGSGAADEREPGKIPFSPSAAERFLLAAKPIWEEALRSRVREFVEGGCVSDVREQEEDEARLGSQQEQGREDCSEVKNERGAEDVPSVPHGPEGQGCQPEGPRLLAWTSMRNGGSQRLLSPLLLTHSDREVVEVEAKRLRCRVEELEQSGYKYLALMPG